MKVTNIGKRILPLILLSVMIAPASIAINTESNQRKPLIRDGKYYYSENDTANHLKGALKFLPKRLLMAPIALSKKAINAIVSIFYPAPAEEPVKLQVQVPEPIQTVPIQSSIKPVITWIGHATFLIQIGDFNILTDPLFGDVKAGPITITKRTVAPGITIDNLPKIDVIIISHNHLDHTNPQSLSAIVKKYPDVVALVPQGDKALFASFGLKKIEEKTWWEEQTFEKNNRTLKLTFLPAKHWSLHLNPFKYRKSLWGSWMISCDNKNIYFAGDTAVEDHFQQIAHKFTSIDVALMPIGPTDPKKPHGHISHIDAKQAIDGFIELNAKCFMPMHYATIFGGPITFEHPVNILHEYWKEKQNIGELKNKKLLFAQCGKQYNV